MPQLLARNLAFLLAIRKVVDGHPTRLQDADGQHVSIFHRVKSSK